ncbi:MAG: hypothetical protein O3C40_26535 [Planctomycetota bacterium]|nr:hypothetical protein [Planctomycetota bacterium]
MPRKRRMLLLGVLGTVVLVAAGTWLWYRSLKQRNNHGSAFEAAYRTAPADDEELGNWFLAQPGVEAVLIRRGPNRPGEWLQADLIMQQDRQRNPPRLEVEAVAAKAESLGYKEQVPVAQASLESERIYWSPADEPGTGPRPIPGIDHATIEILTLGDSMRYVFWTDLSGRHFFEVGGRGDWRQPAVLTKSGHLYRDRKIVAKYECLIPESSEAAWYRNDRIRQEYVEWEPRIAHQTKTGLFRLNDQSFDLAAGSLILVSTVGDEIRIKQLKRDTLQMEPKEETFRDLAKTDAEISEFFSLIAKPDEAQ